MVVDIDTPPAGPTRVRVAEAGLCGSDHHRVAAGRRGFALVTETRRVWSAAWEMQCCGDPFEIGGRIGRMNAAIPAAIVTFDRDWLRVEGVPTYDVWVERTVVLSVQSIRYLWSKGVRFVTADGRYDGLIIWTSAGMTDALRSAGW